MKKKKISSIDLTTDVSTVTRVLGFNASGLISSQRLIGDISAGGMAVPDANLIYTTQEKGLSVLPTSSTPNTPGGNGVILHIQRAPKGQVSNSQIILQIAANANHVNIRTGYGDGTKITYTNWKQL